MHSPLGFFGGGDAKALSGARALQQASGEDPRLTARGRLGRRPSATSKRKHQNDAGENNNVE